MAHRCIRRGSESLIVGLVWVLVAMGGCGEAGLLAGEATDFQAQVWAGVSGAEGIVVAASIPARRGAAVAWRVRVDDSDAVLGAGLLGNAPSLVTLRRERAGVGQHLIVLELLGEGDVLVESRAASATVVETELTAWVGRFWGFILAALVAATSLLLGETLKDVVEKARLRRNLFALTDAAEREFVDRVENGDTRFELDRTVRWPERTPFARILYDDIRTIQRLRTLRRIYDAYKNGIRHEEVLADLKHLAQGR
jgi:hypothetical protein